MFVAVAFLLRAVPHLFFIPMWSPEEEYNYLIVDQLVQTGTTNQLGLYPLFGHLTIYGFHFLGVDSVVFSQFFNPLFSALTVIPLFLLVRKLSSEKVALLSSVFWVFSEAVFYRSAIFSSTETFAFFLGCFALFFYVKKQYIPMAVLLGLAFYTHLLPAFFVLLTVFLHQSIIRGRTVKIVSVASLVGVVLFLLSPLNPHQRIASVIDPAVLFAHFNPSNIFVYSAQDLLFGASIFAGLIVLGLLTVFSVKRYGLQSKFVLSWMLVAIGVFVFSWVVYSPNLFAPPRLTFYFVVPFAFYASVFLVNFRFNHLKTQKVWKTYFVIFVAFMMVTSSILGAQAMLFYENSVSKDEYRALDELEGLGYFNLYPGYYWSDYPVRVAVTAVTSLSNPDNAITVAVNESSVIYNSALLADQNATLNPNTHYKYVFFSERMTEEAFFTVFTHNRTQQVRVPLHDVWFDSELWSLVYQGHGVKLYERKIS